MANMVTIPEARFVELYRKAFETESICRECREEHTAEEFAALTKERDELKERLKKSHDACAHCMADGRLAAAERCIDKIQKIEFDNKPTGLLMFEVDNIIRDYRKAKEAK